MAATPILDLERDPPKPRRSWLFLAYVLVLGLGAGFLLEGRISLDATWWFPILYLSVLVHELGHLAAAKLVGMEAGGIAVGGFLLFKSGDRWVSRFDWRRIFSGGLAKPLLKDGRLGRGPYAWMIAGGPIATALTALVSAVLGRGLDDTIAATFFWINIFLLASTFLPATGAMQSDIPRLVQLARDPAGFRSNLAALQIVSEEANGVLPRDWNAENFAAMLAGRAPGTIAYRRMFAFYRSIDLRDEEAALEYLEEALAASGDGGAAVRQWCFLEAACSAALLRGNGATARVWLERARGVRPPDSSASIEAAIAYSEGRYRDAVDSWDRALKYMAKKRFDSGLARYMKSKVAEYQAMCEDALGQARGQGA